MDEIVYVFCYEMKSTKLRLLTKYILPSYSYALLL